MDDSVPLWHTPYRAVRDGAALFPLPDNGLIEVTGPEREEYLNSLCTNRVTGLKPGKTTRALMLNPTKGRVLADFLVVATEDALWLDCERGCSSTVEALLQRYYFGQDVEFRNHGDEWSITSLQGPLSGEILMRSGATLPADHVGAHIETTIVSVTVRVVRWTDTGEVGFRVWAPVSSEQAVKAALIDAGAITGDDEAWTVLQIEAGMAVFGRELTEDTIPLEAPTENAISHDKGCYPGQEVIARLWARGRPAKRLRGLRLEGDQPPPPGALLDGDDKASVARITAAGVSPDLGSVALAFVHRDYCEAGTRLGGGELMAEVVDLPMTTVKA
jgi:folate-binding protein YgfZ